MTVVQPSYDWDMVTLKWAGVFIDGSIPTGNISLQYDGAGPLLDDDVETPLSIFRKPIALALSTKAVVIDGEARQVAYAEIDVPASNDPDITGGGATYTFSENLAGGAGRKNVSFLADKDAPGGEIWLNKIAGGTPAPGTALSVVQYADFLSLAGRVTELEENGSPAGGAAGEDGESPELRVSGGYIQWKYPSQTTWTNLVALTEITGPAGSTGATGPAGDPTTVADGAIAQAKVANLVSDLSGRLRSVRTLVSSTDTYADVTISDDGTATTNWPNRVMFTYAPATGSNVLVFWVNEYGELRSTPAKPNTVGFRIFAATDATSLTARDATVPVFEVSAKRNPTNERVTVFGIVKDGGIVIGPESGTRHRHGTVLTLDAGQTVADIPATTPAGTLILRRKS